jgi:hypothetical protein
MVAKRTQTAPSSRGDDGYAAPVDGERSARTTTRALRRSRRRHYLSESDWVDSLYKAYVTVIIAGLALFYLTVTLGNTKVATATLATIGQRGPGMLGFGIAVVVALGLRSGARGGPLAPEPADVMYLLLAPIPRATVLRAAAARQLRGVVLVPAIAGAVAGSVTAGRLGGDRAGWIAAGAVAAALVALTAWGAALFASGTRMSIRRANVVALVLIAWSLLDVVAERATAPTAQLGRIALLPLTWSRFAILGMVLALAVAAVGFTRVGNVALEPLRRRARLVGELRFAATLQDMRSVIVLHRELAQELPRSRPWWRPRARGTGAGRTGPCWQRDWRGLARWPVGRVVRVVLLTAAGGLACVGVWHGTDALIAVAGVAVFVAGIDAVEGLAQETDHPTRPQQYPIEWGDLVLSHLVAPTCLLAGVGVIGALVFGLVAGDASAFAVAGIVVVPAALAGAAGAAVSVVLGAPSPTMFLEFGFPEFMTLWLIVRQVLAPLVVVAAFAPVAVAHDAWARGDSAATAALTATVLPLAFVAAASVWLRSRRKVTG